MRASNLAAPRLGKDFETFLSVVRAEERPVANVRLAEVAVRQTSGMEKSSRLGKSGLLPENRQGDSHGDSRLV